MMAVISKPTRLFILLAVVLSVYKIRADSENYKKAVALSNNVAAELTRLILAEMEGVLKHLEWADMLRTVDALVADSEFEKVPNLVSIGVPSLVERAVASSTASFDSYVATIVRKRETIIESKLPLVTALATNKLAADVESYTSDEEVTATFGENMAAVAASIQTKAQEVIRHNTDGRLERLAYIFGRALQWKSVTYERFLYHVISIRSEMNAGSQLDTWVQLETQTIVAEKHMAQYLSTEFMEEHIGEASTFIETMDRTFSDDSDIYFDLDEFFSRRASSVTSILASQYSRTYGLRITAIDSDSLLDDNQKRVLKAYARQTRDESEASHVSVTSSIGEIRSFYRAYGSRLLNELRVVILATFLEYEAVSLRSQSEGRQTCIVQFYQMRRALDDAFFFEYCRERNFNLELTVSDFEAELDTSLADAGQSLLSLARTGYIHYMYDNARSFLLSRVNLFFRGDVIVLAAVKPMLASLHDDYATIIPLRIQNGVDDELATETELARLSVQSTLSKFTTNMEFSFVTDLINGVNSSIVDDIVAKVDDISRVFRGFSAEFITEALGPFDFAWFQAQSEQFITDDKIRFVDMKQHVIEKTNEHATATLETNRSDLTQQVEALFAKVGDFTAGVLADLSGVVGATSKQDEAAKRLLQSTLDGTVASMSSFSHTMKNSVLVSMEEVLGGALIELEDVQAVRLRNFFNTKIQVLKDAVVATATERITAVYQEHMENIETQMLSFSAAARVTYREHVDELLDLERGHRKDVDEVAQPVLEAEAAKILADYNIVSFTQRQITLVVGMKNAVRAAVGGVATQRRLAVLRFTRKWSDARSAFRGDFMAAADDLKAGFRAAMVREIQRTKALAVDIMGHVDNVIDALEQDLFHVLETSYSNIVDTIVGTDDNDLPEALGIASVVYAPGITGLTESPVLPSVAFLKDTEEEGAETAYADNGEALPSVDEPSGLTTLEILLALMPFDDWLVGKLDELVQAIVIDMQHDLKQNTCRNNKPPCREGWVQFTNTWEVDCCRFDPASQGHQPWKIARMLGFEILLALVLDLENLIDLGKWVGTPLAAKGKKAMAAAFQKLGGKSGKSMTKALKLAARSGGKKMTAVATKVGVKIGVKVGTKVAARGGAIAAKVAVKAGMGPVGWALFVFDIISLIVDLWDPSGYNDSQTNGIIRAYRDQLEKNYSQQLSEAGYESPLAADVMFMLSPSRQEAVSSDAVLAWFQEEVADFMTVNESAFESMPDSETQTSISDEYERLALELEEDPNLVTTLVASKLENVFLQDINVRENHRNPYTEGRDSARIHVRKNLPNSGIVEAVLNETGVKAHNDFQVVKNAFINSLEYNQMGRFVKRENNYVITKTVASQHYMERFSKLGSPSNISFPIVHVPSLQGCKDYGNSLLNGSNRQNHALGREILDNMRQGWIFVIVEPEEEFWVQYDHDPGQNIVELLDRTKYHVAHDRLAAEGRARHELAVDSMISVHLDEIAPEGAAPLNAGHLKVAHLSTIPSNWTHDGKGEKVLKYPVSEDVEDFEKISYTLQTIPSIPEWAPSYTEAKETFAALLEESYSDNYRVNQAAFVAAYKARQDAEKARLEAKAAEVTLETGKSKTYIDIRFMELEQARLIDPPSPEFAVFLNGYGQNSPLLAIKEQCDELGLGVSYNKEKGLCNFSQSYCQRYGLDFFYNEGLGVYDCDLSRGQVASEFIFGVTVTRSTKRGVQSLGSASVAPGACKRVGACQKALGASKLCKGVSAKHVQNGEMYNYLEPSTSFSAIKTLGLSGF